MQRYPDKALLSKKIFPQQRINTNAYNPLQARILGVYAE